MRSVSFSYGDSTLAERPLCLRSSLSHAHSLAWINVATIQLDSMWDLSAHARTPLSLERQQASSPCTRFLWPYVARTSSSQNGPKVCMVGKAGFEPTISRSRTECSGDDFLSVSVNSSLVWQLERQLVPHLQAPGAHPFIAGNRGSDRHIATYRGSKLAGWLTRTTSRSRPSRNL